MGPLLALVLTASWLVPGPALSQVPPEMAGESERDDGPEAVPGEDLEAFVDGMVAAYMERDRLAGVTVSVVRGGETVLLKGYGRRNGEGDAVNPEQTLFRVASISKTFIWVALMQLEEQGLIALDDPVNDHLPPPLQLPRGPGDSVIRIHHLMAHTAGFEDSLMGHLLEREETALRPLNDYLAAVRPALVREAGHLATYSNYGSALAGALVAHVSGQPFEQYVEERIFAPLGMTHASFREPYDPDRVAEGMPAPLSEDLAMLLSEGFRDRDGLLEPAHFEYLAHTAPSGGLSASAADIARFMRMLLNDGSLDGAVILQAETAHRMRQTLFTNREGINGLAHGFIERRLPGGLQGYGHGGALVHFFSDMLLVPALDLGIFVSTNTAGGRAFTRALTERIVARLHAETETPPSPPAGFADIAERYAGQYRHTRRNYTTSEKLGALDSLTHVSVHEDGYLVTRGNGPARRWVKLEDGDHLFQRVDGPERIAFGEDERGRIHYLYHDSGINAGERIGYFATPRWLMTIAGLTALMAVWQIGAAWARRRSGADRTRIDSLVSGFMCLWGLAWLGYLAVAGAAINRLIAAGAQALFTWPEPILRVSLLMANLATLFSLLALLTLYPVWRQGSWSLRQRLYHSVAVITAGCMVLALWQWNLIGWRL